MQDKILRKIAKYSVTSAEPLINHFVMPRLSTPNGDLLTPDAIFNRAPSAIIIGAPGTGKTTLLCFLAYSYSRAYLADPENNPAATFIPARHFNRDSTVVELQRAIAEVLSEQVQAKVTREMLGKYIEEDRLILLIDGLDEIGANASQSILYQLAELLRRYSNSRIILSSRLIPLRVYFGDSTFFYLKEFGDKEIHQLVSHLSNNPQQAHDFIEAITIPKSLASMARNPLTLSLLWGVYKTRGRIPEVSTSLYTDLTDYLMSTWEKQKGIGARSIISLQDKQFILERLALFLLKHEEHTVSLSDLTKLIQKTLAYKDLKHIETSIIVQELLTSGLLVRTERDSAHFAHLSLLEYYVARAVSRDPPKVIDLLPHPNAYEAIILACEMMEDIEPVIEVAIERKQIVLAAQCLSRGRTNNRMLIDLVIKEFVQKVGEPFIETLVSTYGPTLHVQRDKKHPKDDYAELLDLWDKFSAPNLTSHEKGKRFEEFASLLFGHVFKVVNHNLNTENGEVDIVLEITNPEPFWIEFGGDALVECKNWDGHIPLKEVASFSHKVNQARVKLGFVVSVSGFTDDAIRTLRNNASNVIAPLVVPISGDDIKKLIRRKGQFDDFFKNKIRKIKYLRKY